MVKVGKSAPQKLVNVGGKLVEQPAPPPPAEAVEAQIGTPNVQGDRRAAQAMLRNIHTGAGATSAAAATTKVSRGLDAEEKELAAKLQELGALPPPPAKIDRAQLEEATRRTIEKHLESGELPQDMEELLALVDSLMRKRNASRPAAQWSGKSSAGRPASLPPAASYPAGPAPNQKALQAAAAQAVATAQPPPAPGSINAKIAEATQQYMGTSTRAGPDGGNLACAWSVNNILANAGIQKVGSNTNYVPSVEADLQGGRGTAIDAKDARPGDIVIWPHGHHIGIAMGDGKVANNSSSRASFTGMQDLPAGARVYRLNS